ncbi:hypothetical protein XMIN_4541 [Xanthomonas citri pv. mangiferaeindicae LMG 941]|nr:hypothetical protein XMIN_4541 [Xanthomonas citri pv. mangiferaeindicae LMG 941]
MCSAGIGVDTECYGRGGLATDLDVALGQGGAGQRGVAATLRDWDAWIEAAIVRCTVVSVDDVATDIPELITNARLGGIAVRIGHAVACASDTTADRRRRGAVVHLVLQIGKRQRLGGQFAGTGIGAGDGTADQVHVAGGDVITAIARKQTRLLDHAQIIAVGLGPACIAAGIPRGARRDLHPATDAAFLRLDVQLVLQRFDGQIAAGLHIDPVALHHRTTQGSVAFRGEYDVLAGQLCVLPGAAIHVRLVAASAGLDIRVHTSLRADRGTDTHFEAGISALALFGIAGIARFQHQIARRIQAQRVARLDVALHDVQIAFGGLQAHIATTGDGGALRDLAAAVEAALVGGETHACFDTE